MSGEILFLAHRMPFPPDRGDKIRSSHVLRALAALAPVHVATFAETAQDRAEEGELEAVATSHCLVSRTKPLPLAGVEALLRGRPISLTAFRSARIADYVAKVLRERPISAIYVFSGQMGQYVPADFAGRVIADFVDVDSAKFEAYGAQGSGPRSWIDAREGRLLRDEEARIAVRADVSLLISREEAALFAARLTPEERAAAKIEVLRNGIDSGHFDPVSVTAEPRLAACSSPRLIFTGQMDYAPNVAAAQRLITHILPLVKRSLPAASAHIVGRAPPPELLALHCKAGAYVWGEVADMRGWLAEADIAVVPLSIARGVQNKVLEAMAMALPMVLTSGAATGIPARDGYHFAIADSDEAIAAQIIALHADAQVAQAMGQAARAFVVEEMSWHAALADLPQLLGLGQNSARHAA